jgi:demethylmenaquinone methyltransferase/2-methoxy-6-polyprenyl-1,4-benzoquinol methylase
MYVRDRSQCDRDCQRNQSSEITGIDISKEMLNIAENKVKMLGLNNVYLYERNAFDTGYQDNTFDVIVIALVLHEVSQEACRKIILEAKRI